MSSSGGYLFKFTAVIAVAVYVLLGSYIVQPGTAYIQDWSLDVAVEEAHEQPENADERSNDQWIPYRVQNYFGYVRSDGRLALRSPLQWNVALSEDTFCSYSRQGDDLVIRDPRRNYLYPLNISGYPVERNGGYYVLSPDLTGITAFSSTGEFGFRREFPSLITSIDANAASVGVGLLNGRVELFNQDGSYRAGVRPETSRINAVYGTALSEDSDYLAMVHGIDPQFLSLYELNGANVRLFSQSELSVPTRSQTKIGFTRNGEFLLCEDGKRVLMLSTADSAQKYALPFEGELVDFDFRAELESIFILSSENEESVLSIYSEEGRRYSREVFAGQAQWLYSGDGALYLGCGDRLKKIQIERTIE